MVTPEPASRPALTPDCSRCFGLCCVALPFARSPGAAGFAFDKAAGEACRHLAPSDACAIHADLLGAGMGGCVAYECFGAGQQVSQVTYGGVSWREQPGTAAQMYAVLGVVRRLHEMLALLDQVPGSEALREVVSRHAAGTPEHLLALDVDEVAGGVGDALRAHSTAVRAPAGPSYAGADLAGRDLRAVELARADLRGALLIAADLRGVVLDRVDLLGADLRDADLAGADLSTTLFLTRPQVATARGDATTRLPEHLRRPFSWPPAPAAAREL